MELCQSGTPTVTVHIIVGLSKATKDGENNERTPGIFEETLIKREIIWTAHCCDWDHF